jgi:hypothetical protein
MALEDKFTELQALMADQQTAIVNALDSILTALGAPPPTATVTLADTLAMMVALNNNVIGMAIANGSYHAAVLEALAQLNTNTDLMITNNSLNAQRTIAAVLSTYCPCPTGADLLPLPLDVTPTTLADEAKCKRIQFYLALFLNWLGKIANYGGAGAFITGDIIGTLLGLAAAEAGIVATGAEVGTVLGPPGVVIGAIVGLIVGAVGIFGASVLTDYYNQFLAAPVQTALLNALFCATNADEGNTAFQGVIADNFSPIPAGIINALWWAQWNNDIYSGSPTVDDSAYNGTICVCDETFPPTEGCVTFMSETATYTNGQVIQNIVWPGGGTISPTSASGAAEDLVCDKAVFGHTPINNLWITVTGICRVFWDATGFPNWLLENQTMQLPATGGDYYTAVSEGDPFSVTLCVDEP